MAISKVRFLTDTVRDRPEIPQVFLFSVQEKGGVLNLLKIEKLRKILERRGVGGVEPPENTKHGKTCGKIWQEGKIASER